MRLMPVADFTNQDMAQWVRRRLAPGCHVVSDGPPAFAQVRQMGGTHERQVTGGGRQGARYLAEFCYRFNRRFDLPAMLPRLLRALATTRRQPLKALQLPEISKESGQMTP